MKNRKILSENAKQWEEERKFREKQSRVKSQIDYIVNYIKNLPNPDDISSSKGKDLPDIARHFIDNCRPRLMEIKKVMGQHDSLKKAVDYKEILKMWQHDKSYMDLSSAVASHALNFCIVYSNRTQNYTKALEVMENIATLDMSPELRKRFNENKSITLI